MRSRPAWHWLIGATFVALGTYWFAMGAHRIREQLAGYPWDFDVDWSLAKAFLEGYNPYTPAGAHRAKLDTYPSQLGHPPTTAFWALPFTSLSLDSATFGLGLICVSLLAFQIITTVRELRVPMGMPIAWLGLAFVVSSEYFAYHVRVGQVSEVIGFCLFLAWLGIRWDDDTLMGVALGAACSMKPFPAVAVLLLVPFRRYRALVTAAGFYLVIATIMTLRFGFSAWPLFLATQKATAKEWLASIQNQSIHGIVAHLFRPTCRPPGPVTPGAVLTSVTLSAALIGGAYRVAHRMPKTRDSEELLFGGFVLLSIFTSQWAWEHYNVILVVPFGILAAELAARARRSSNAKVTLLGCAGLLLALTALRVPINEKQMALEAVHRGDQTKHLRLHLYEGLNSAPLVLLLVVATVLVAARLREVPARR